MSRRLVATLLAFTLSASLAGADPVHPASVADALDSDDFGRYQVLRSGEAVARLVFAFGADGDAALSAAAAALIRHGALVARIDVDRFAAGVGDRRDACLDLSAIVNWHANDLGRRYGLSASNHRCWWAAGAARHWCRYSSRRHRRKPSPAGSPSRLRAAWHYRSPSLYAGWRRRLAGARFANPRHPARAPGG